MHDPTRQCPLDLDEALARAGDDREFLRELVEMFLADVPQRIEELRDALEAAEAAGLGPADLEDLRPLLDRQLAFLARWFLAGRERLDVEALAELFSLAGRLAGDRVLGGVRRWLVGGPEDVPREDLLRLARAAGLARDALAPADHPVRTPAEPADFDDSVA